MRQKAQAAAARACARVTVRDGVAESLPFGDDEFDAAVATLTLCTVGDQPRALAELRRVVRPGGELRFFEHVGSSRPRHGRVQRGLDRSGIWPWFAGGCHCSRDTLTAIAAAGFTIETCTPVNLGPAWFIANPHVVGRARAPG